MIHYMYHSFVPIISFTVESGPDRPEYSSRATGTDFAPKYDPRLCEFVSADGLSSFQPNIA